MFNFVGLSSTIPPSNRFFYINDMCESLLIVSKGIFYCEPFFQAHVHYSNAAYGQPTFTQVASSVRSYPCGGGSIGVCLVV